MNYIYIILKDSIDPIFNNAFIIMELIYYYYYVHFFRLGPKYASVKYFIPIKIFNIKIFDFRKP